MRVNDHAFDDLRTRLLSHVNESEGYSPWFLQGRFIPIGWLQDFKARGGALYTSGDFARCNAVLACVGRRWTKGQG
jgi:hypothetical protein